MNGFLKLVDAQFLRNKREHDDNYLGMNSKNEPLVDSSGTGGVTINVAQSVTVFRHGKIYLGGTLDVHKTINSADIAIRPLMDIQHDYWKKRHAEYFLEFQIPRNLIDK